MRDGNLEGIIIGSRNTRISEPFVIEQIQQFMYIV
jgi:hypothetical protein